MLAVILIFILLFGGLYLRKHLDPKTRVAPYRESLVPADFWRSVKPSAEGSADRPLVVWVAINWPPDSKTPLTQYAYQLSKFLVRTAGWSVVAIVPDASVVSYDDMPILKFDQRPLVELAISRAHCILALGAVVEAATKTAAAAKKPLWVIAQTPNDPSPHQITPAAWINPSALWVHPPFYPKQHQTHTTRAYITLIGCSAADAPKHFYELARQFPHFSFLAVAGPEGTQISPPKLPNLRTMRAPADMRAVYSETGILVIFGTAEIFPMRPLEAAASGIPTVGIRSPGLEEALGDAGIFCDSPEEIAAEIERLRSSSVAWEAASRAAVKRATTAYNSTEELERFRLALLDSRLQ